MPNALFGAFGNGTTAPATNWQPEPNARGTWSIISTCVITLSLCLWSSLHLNIPSRKGAKVRRARKVVWLVTGLLGPELVAVIALTQLRHARRLTRAMQAELGEDLGSETRSPWWKIWSPHGRTANKSGSTTHTIESGSTQASYTGRRHPWTEVHSFYAIMGGFAFDTSNAKPNFLPNGLSRLALREGGMRYLGKHAPHLIPDLSTEDIKDKSKADGLAKLIICLQAAWFSIQVIFRIAQQQAISFLELNTFCHAFCALLVYAMWWHKPLDIESPTLLDSEEALELSALMCVHSWKSCDQSEIVSEVIQYKGHTWNLFHDQTEFNTGMKYGDRTMGSWADVFTGRYRVEMEEFRFKPYMVLRWDPVPDRLDDDNEKASADITADESPAESQTSSNVVMSIKKGQSLFGFRCIDVYTEAAWYQAQGITEKRSRLAWLRLLCEFFFKILDPHIYEKNTIVRDRQRRGDTTNAADRECPLDASDVYRWQLASSAWKKYLPERCTQDDLAPLSTTVGDRVQNGLTDAHSGGEKGDDTMEVILRLTFITLAGGAYGGLHLLAWNAVFATSWQRLLWRASGLIIAATGPIAMLWRLFKVIDRKMLPNDEKVYKAGSTMLILLIILIYLPARFYLVIESCIQVSKLPPGAYVTTDWAKYYPHIG